MKELLSIFSALGLLLSMSCGVKMPSKIGQSSLGEAKVLKPVSHPDYRVVGLWEPGETNLRFFNVTTQVQINLFDMTIQTRCQSDEKDVTLIASTAIEIRESEKENEKGEKSRTGEIDVHDEYYDTHYMGPDFCSISLGPHTMKFHFFKDPKTKEIDLNKIILNKQELIRVQEASE